MNGRDLVLKTKYLVCENFVFHRFLGHYFEIVFLFLSIYDTYILRVLRNILESLLGILTHTQRQTQLCLDFLSIEGGIKKSAPILSSFNVLTSCPLSSPPLQTHSMLYVCMKIISVPMTTCHPPSQALFSNSVIFNIETFKRTASEIKNVNSRACDFVIMQSLLFFFFFPDSQSHSTADMQPVVMPGLGQGFKK